MLEVGLWIHGGLQTDKAALICTRARFSSPVSGIVMPNTYTKCQCSSFLMHGNIYIYCEGPNYEQPSCMEQSRHFAAPAFLHGRGESCELEPGGTTRLYTGLHISCPRRRLLHDIRVRMRRNICSKFKFGKAAAGTMPTPYSIDLH